MNHAESNPAGSVEGQHPIGPISIALTLLTAALWGGTPVAISFSVDTLPPIAVSGIRFALAALFMFVWCRFEGSELRLRPGQFVPSLILGTILFFQIALFTVGIQMSNSSHGTLLINTFVFWVAGIEHFVTRTIRLTPMKVLGLVVAAAGVFLIFDASGSQGESAISAAQGDAPNFLGDVLLLGSACLLGIKIIYTKQAVMSVEPGKLIFWHDVFGVVLFSAYSLPMETIHRDDFSMPAILGLLYQGVIVAGFCFAVQAQLLKRHSASQLAVFSFATPLFGIALASFFRDDKLSPWLIASVACVAVGIIIVNRRSSSETKP